MPKIPATVVTGFLGAGKTTLIRHLLENAEGRRIALIINEFGDLGVDGEIVRGCGLAACGFEEGEGVVELSNGCICCAVADDFVPALERLLALPEPPEHIVVETSGLALPQPLVRAFDWPMVRTRVTVDGVVAVVDGAALAAGRFAADEGAVARQRAADGALDHATPLSDLFEDQLACADLVLLNKADLLGDRAETVGADLRARVRDGVQVLAIARGEVPLDVALGRGRAAEADMAARSEVHHDHDHHHDDDHDHDHGHDHDHDHGHGHDAFESLVLDLPEAESPEALATMVQTAIRAQDLLRVKGFASVAGKPMRLVLQAVGPRIDTHYDRRLRPDEARGTRLVVIGRAGIDRAALARALGAVTEAA